MKLLLLQQQEQNLLLLLQQKQLRSLLPLKQKPGHQRVQRLAPIQGFQCL